MAEEIELKFLLDAQVLDTLAERLGAGPPFELHAVYLDSPDGALRRNGWSLRIREEDGRRVQTAKGPRSGLLGRTEIDSEVEGDEPQLEAESLAPLRRVLDGAAVQAAFTVRTQRQTAQLQRDGVEVEAAFDHAVITAGGESATFHELELELKSGDPSRLFDLARELGRDAPLELAFDTKAERGYALAGADVEGSPSPPAAELTAGAAFQAAARQNLAQAQTSLQVFLARRSPEALHQTRVALRRLRSLLSAFRPVAEDEAYDGVRESLKALASGLNPARDLDVLSHDVFEPASAAADVDERDGLAAFGSALHARRTEAYDAAVKLLGSAERRRTMLDAAAWLEVGPWTRAGDAPRREQPATAFAAGTLDKLRRRLKRSGAGLASMSSHDRHEVRIQAKKLRYAADAFAPLFPAHARRRKRFFRALKTLQEALGALNDRAVGRGLAFEVAVDAGSAAAFAAGRLTAAREADAAGLLARAAAAYEDLVAAKPFWRA